MLWDVKDGCSLSIQHGALSLEPDEIAAPLPFLTYGNGNFIRFNLLLLPSFHPLASPPRCGGRLGGLEVGQPGWSGPWVVLPWGEEGGDSGVPAWCAGPHRHWGLGGASCFPSAISLPGTGKAGFALTTISQRQPPGRLTGCLTLLGTGTRDSTTSNSMKGACRKLAAHCQHSHGRAAVPASAAPPSEGALALSTAPGTR